MLPDIILIVLSVALGSLLTSAYHVLRSLSWRTIRRLEQRYDRAYVNRVEKWFDLRNELRIILRLLSLIALCIGLTSAFHLINAIAVRYQYILDLPTLCLLAVIIAFVYVCLTESISAFLTRLHTSLLFMVIPPVLFFYWFFYVILIIPIHLHQRTEKHFLEQEESEDRNATEEEIEAILELEAHKHEENENGDNASGIEQSTGRMIRGVLDLDETLVREIMTPRVDVIAVSDEEKLSDVRAKILECGHSRIPVYHENIDNIIGIIYSKDLLASSLTEDTPLTQIMHKAVYIPETKTVDKLLQEFKENKVHIAVVIDEYGGTAGIVSLEDILEEIVGDIDDEFDAPNENNHEWDIQEDGSVILEGRTTVEEVMEKLQVEFEDEEDNVTIGGLVTSTIGRIPKTGEEFLVGPVRVKVLEADERKILSLQLWKDSDENNN